MAVEKVDWFRGQNLRLRPRGQSRCPNQDLDTLTWHVAYKNAFKGTLCEIYSHLAIWTNCALQRLTFSSTVAVMYQKAMTGCLLIALCRVFLQLNRFVISNKLQLDTANKQMFQYELLTVKNTWTIVISIYAFFIRHISHTEINYC